MMPKSPECSPTLERQIVIYCCMSPVLRENQHCGLCVKLSTRIRLSTCMLHRRTRTDTFQESLLYTSFPLRQNVSAQISLHRLCRLIWVDTLRRGHTVSFLVGWLIYWLCNLKYSKNIIFVWFNSFPVMARRSWSLFTQGSWIKMNRCRDLTLFQSWQDGHGVCLLRDRELKWTVAVI